MFAHSLRELRAVLLPTASVAAAGAIGALWALAAYTLGVVPAALLLVAGVAAAAIAARPIMGVCLALVAVPFEYTGATFGGGFAITAPEALLLTTAVSAAPRLLTRLSPRDVPAPVYAFGALTLLSATGIFFAVDTFTVVRITLMWMTFLTVSLLIATSSAREVRLVLISLGLAAGILGAIAVTGASGQKAEAGGAIVTGRAQASFQHPTALALFLIMTFPAAFAVGLSERAQLRVLMLAAGFLGLAGLLLTQTRGAIIGGAITLLVMLAWRPFRRLAAAGLVAALLVAALNLGTITKSEPVTVVGERLSTIGSLTTRGNDRLTIWSTTPSIIGEYPFLGVGQGNFPDVSPSFGLLDIGGAPYDHAHNLVLNVTVELGFAGLALLATVAVTLAVVVRRILSDRGDPLFPYALATSASIAGLAINSLSEYPVRQNVVAATIAIVLGVIFAIDRLQRLGDPAGSSQPR